MSKRKRWHQTSFCALVLVACTQPRPAPGPAARPDTAPLAAGSAVPSNATMTPPEALPSVEAACQRFASAPVPQADFASDTERTALKGCDAEASYYGIDMPIDRQRARQCALGERRPGGSPAIVNPAVLMMIYANGFGAPANYDLALGFACQVGGAPAELGGRVSRLWAARAGEKWSAPFDQCDDATSGVMTGYCADLQERIAVAARKARLRAAAAGLPPREFAALQRAAQRFFEARSTKEVDRSGSQAASLVISERAQLEESFVQALNQVREPVFRPAPGDAQALASELARLLARIAACKDLKQTEQSLPGLVNSTGIRETEQRWLAYRAAFVALALEAHPNTSAEIWISWLTQPRLSQLKELATGC